MSGLEKLIGAGLAVVLVVGIIDAAAGHDESSKPTPSTMPTGTESPQTSQTPTTEVSPTAMESTPTRGGGKHGGGMAPTAAPSTAATSAGSASSAPTSAATTSATASAPPGVLGTFSYATTGSEGTNIPGTHRNFPKTTKITNKLQGCGVASTWKPIPEHVQKQVLCPAGDGIKVKSQQTTIMFFGVTSGENFKCSGPSYVYRKSVAAGDTWKFKCKSADATAVQTSTAVGFETIDVGGTAVKTLHVHVDTTLRGNDSGTSTQDYWIAVKKPVLVKEVGEVTATQQSVHYSSTYSLALKSLSPKT